MVVHNPLFGAGPEQIRIIGGARNFRADALPRRSRGLVIIFVNIPPSNNGNAPPNA